jgi:cell division septal protein FtsQ
MTFFTVKNIVVRGNDTIDTSRVLSLAAIEKDMSLFKMNTSGIKKNIGTLPEVKKVKIRRRIPNTVVITIVERKPIAIVNNGLQYFVDNTGYLWPIKPNTYWDLPIISGLKDTVINKKMHALKKSDVRKIHDFFSHVKMADKSIAMDLSQIDFSKEGAVFVKFESKPTLVRLSSFNIKENIVNLKKIFTTVENKNGGMPGYINLCFNNIAFVK